jgi:predicted small lipoprotein YifL
MRAVSLLLLTTLILAACGVKGPPTPAGPPNEITWPKQYPNPKYP